MKTLVVAHEGTGAWLAEHLGCTLYNGGPSGDGLVTKVQEVNPEVWDQMIILEGGEQIPGAINYSHLDEKLGNLEFMRTILEGQGFQMDLGGGDGYAVGLLAYYEEGWRGKVALVVEQMGLMNRDLGPWIDVCTGVTVQAVEGELVNDVLRRLEGLLESTGYRGFIGIRLTVTGKGYLVRGLTLGLPTGWGETMLEIQPRGTIVDRPMEITDNPAVGVLCSRPPFPYNGIEVPGVATWLKTPDPGALRHLRLMDVARGKEGLFGTGTTNSLFYATAWGEDAKEARLRIYRSLRHLEIPGLQYRTDISSTFDVVVDGLKSIPGCLSGGATPDESDHENHEDDATSDIPEEVA